MKELIDKLEEVKNTLESLFKDDDVSVIHKAIQALEQREKPITFEEIEYRIKEEYKKHKELDWAKIAAGKIHALLK